MHRPTRILAALVLAAGTLSAAAACNRRGADPYAHCYDEQGNYDDDIEGCPDDDIHIPTYKAPKPKAKVNQPKAPAKKAPARPARPAGRR